MTNETFRRYLVSSMVTFLSTFLMVLGGQLAVGVVSVDNLSGGLVLSLLAVAGRAATKAVIEQYTISGDKVR